MEARLHHKDSFSSIIYYSILVWTVACFIGTWFLILSVGIFQKGFIGTMVLVFFATIIWAIPFAGLVLCYFYVSPGEEAGPSSSQ